MKNIIILIVVILLAFINFSEGQVMSGLYTTGSKLYNCVQGNNGGYVLANYSTTDYYGFCFSSTTTGSISSPSTYANVVLAFRDLNTAFNQYSSTSVYVPQHRTLIILLLQ